MYYDPTREWDVALTEITLPNDNAHFIYLKVPMEEGVTTSEFIADEAHVDMNRDENYLIYEWGCVQSVADGRGVSMLWGNVKPTFPDAPSDDKIYGRKNKTWVEVVGGGGGEDGREVELSTSGGYFVWRYVGDPDWINLAAVPGDGEDGRGIASLVLTGTVGKTKTYTVTFTDFTTFSFDVQDGADGATGGGSLPKQVPGLTLVQADWALVAGLYEYNLANANITANSIVDVIPENASIAIVKAAEVLPMTVSSAGSVKMYSTNAPGGDISITINITEGTL